MCTIDVLGVWGRDTGEWRTQTDLMPEGQDPGNNAGPTVSRTLASSRILFLCPWAFAFHILNSLGPLLVISYSKPAGCGGGAAIVTSGLQYFPFCLQSSHSHFIHVRTDRRSLLPSFIRGASISFRRQALRCPQQTLPTP